MSKAPSIQNLKLLPPTETCLPFMSKKPLLALSCASTPWSRVPFSLPLPLQPPSIAQHPTLHRNGQDVGLEPMKASLAVTTAKVMKELARPRLSTHYPALWTLGMEQFSNHKNLLILPDCLSKLTLWKAFAMRRRILLRTRAISGRNIFARLNMNLSCSLLMDNRNESNVF